MDQIDLGDFTVEAWFKALSAPGTWSRVFDFGKGGPGDFFGTKQHGFIKIGHGFIKIRHGLISRKLFKSTGPGQGSELHVS